MEALKSLLSRIDGLSLRERSIVLGAVIVTIYFLFDMIVMQPLDVMQKNVQNNIVRINTDVVALNAQLQELVATSPEAQREKDLEEVQRLRQELTRLDAELQSTAANLVNPDQMTGILQAILAQTSGLRLRKVNSLGASPLILGQDSATRVTSDTNVDGEDTQAATATSISTVYKHGMQIEFTGSFHSTLEYLKKLEALEWKFFWDNIKYEVSEYPDAISTLSMYTISLDQDWIGI